MGGRIRLSHFILPRVYDYHTEEGVQSTTVFISGVSNFFENTTLHIFETERLSELNKQQSTKKIQDTRLEEIRKHTQWWRKVPNQAQSKAKIDF